jgi:hypothetical protein
VLDAEEVEKYRCDFKNYHPPLQPVAGFEVGTHVGLSVLMGADRRRSGNSAVTRLAIGLTENSQIAQLVRQMIDL